MLGGGRFARNAVWDAYHFGSTELIHGDVDVVYFDAAHIGEEVDEAIESVLLHAMPGVVWSVKNQARMHWRNGDRPHASTSDAMMHWPEVCTAIAARYQGERVEVLAPFGVDDLVNLRVRPTPAFETKAEIYRDRIARKRWRDRWTRLTFD